MSTIQALTDCSFYYASTDRCSKAEKCPFRHEPSARSTTEECLLFQQKQCRNRHCSKRHTRRNTKVPEKIPVKVDPPLLKQTDCFFYYNGQGCNKVSECLYRHESAALGATEECPDFQQNKCTKKHCNKKHSGRQRSAVHSAHSPKSDDLEHKNTNAIKSVQLPTGMEKQSQGRVPLYLIDCQYFYTNHKGCLRGEKCLYRHESKAKGVNEVCQLFKENKCKNVQCGYRHPNNMNDIAPAAIKSTSVLLRQKKLQDCEYYYSGNCKRGDKCFFRHEPSAKDATEECPFFLQYKCLDPQCNKRHGRISRVITKNPEDERWSYVCRENNPTTKIQRKLYLYDVSLSDLLEVEMTCLDEALPIPSSEPIICTRFVEDDCERIDCRYYHCKSPFYWQIQYSPSFWINLTEMQSRDLECTYCDVSKTQCNLGVLDPYTFTDSHPLFKLLSSETWTANFDKMKLTGSNSREIKLRRLSTPSFVDLSYSDASTFWIWFYEDEVTKKWTAYSSALDETANVNISEVLEKAFIGRKTELTVSVAGTKFIVDLVKFHQVNSISKNIQRLRRRPQQDGIKEVEWSFWDNHNAWFPYGKQNQEGFLCTVTSADIEKAYQQNPSGTMTFQSTNSKTSFNYVIDFKQMTQQNQQTNVIRKMNRVEKCSKIKKKISSRQVIQAELPSTWSAEMGGEICKTFPLSDRSSEYNEILQFFNQTAGGAVKRVVKISRVQNTRLYRNFCNKRDDMMKQYNNDAAVVNEQRLFHGTRPDVVDMICKGNFNWRYTGTNVGHVYGRGSYFSNQSRTSIAYCRADSSNHMFIFTARVLVGKTILGDGEMVMPPEQSTGVLYDTTVNSVSNPIIIVTYQDDSCYPEYLIEYMA